MDWTGTEEKAITQGSGSWHAWRSGGIGASEIAIVMGVSPFGNVYDLWLDKTGQLPEYKKFKGNFATDRGNRLEPIARDMFERKIGLKFPPEIFEHKRYSFIRASLDGVNHDVKRVIEIKVPGKAAHQKALSGEVPEYYWPQVQQQMLVTGYDDLTYISWDGESKDLVTIDVKADKEYQSSLVKAAVEFWGLVTTMTPPSMGEVQIEDQALTSLLNDRERIKSEIDALTIGLEMTNNKIREMAPQDCICSGWKIKYSDVKGSVDYSSIPALTGIDLEQYRKPPSRRLNITKEKK